MSVSPCLTYKEILTVALGLALTGCGQSAPIGTLQTRTAEAPAIQQVNLPAAAFSTLVPDDIPTVTLPLVVPTRARREVAPSVGGNDAQLSVSPSETLPAVKAFISGAKHTLWIEMFELGGTYGEKIVPLLLERARAGVKIRLLLDQVGSGSKAKGIKPWAEELRAAGVEIVFYAARLRNDHHGEHRFNISHRKLLLADADVAMEGGTNLGTDFDTTEQDLMVRWRGPVVADLYREFGIEWNFVGGSPLQLPLGPMASAGIIDAQVAVTSTPEGRFEIQDALFKAIDGAQLEIIIENQYLWDDTMITHLLGALKRGVKVRVIVPGGTKEKFILSSLNMVAVHQLVQAGAEARGFYNPNAPEAHLHTKYFSVDNRWVMAGSANGDQRSFTDHQELDVISTEPGFVKEMRTRVFDQDWNHASKPWTYRALHIWSQPVLSLIDLAAYYF